jgi:hypothetical protein
MYLNNMYPSLMKSTNGVTPDRERERERGRGREREREREQQWHLVEQEEGITHII